MLAKSKDYARFRRSTHDHEEYFRYWLTQAKVYNYLTKSSMVTGKGETIIRVNGNVLFSAGKRLQTF